jgi:pyruvate dehydrogenase E1 component alpha subunit/2-oxoisovalerate dehydrogenase E1 component alpha subunit
VPRLDLNATPDGPAVSRDFLRSVFGSMLRARILENKLSSLYKAGKIVGGVYLGRGQEAVSATLGTALVQGTDFFAPLIRDQAGRTAFGESLLDCTRTYLGSIHGPMRGRDGNIHRGRPRAGMPAMISHLGAQVPLVAGMLFAKRLQGTLTGRVGATCIGDGASSTGAFHEGLNLAAVEKLPLVVVIGNNQFAYSTPTEAVRRARAGHGPQIVVAQVLRLSGHGEHDDASYVPGDVKQGHYGRDCIEVAMHQLVENGLATGDEIRAWQERFAEDVQRAVAQAQQEETPDPYHEHWTALSTRFPLPAPTTAQPVCP